MEKGLSWEAKRFSTSQEISCVLWKLKVHCRIHKCRPPVPTLSQINPVHVPPSHFVKIHLNITLSSNSGSSKWSFSFRFPTKTLYTLLLFPCYMYRPSHYSLFDHPKNICWGVQIMKLLILRFLHSPVTAFPLGPHVLLREHPLYISIRRSPN